ncbi:MAG: hypothetical protein DMG07_00715 [Acidobacteria bacterium]|nr:MAG: hypothetical protein DMG07_00715 [Acidobacteriota bacterium]
MRRSLQPLIPFLSCLALAAGATAKDDKPKPDQLVASHLAALGSAEKRAAVKSRAATGTVQVVFRLGAQGQLSGPAALLSVGHKARINWAFNQLEYPGEQFGFDGSRVTVGLVRPGVRSNLSEFIYQFDYLLKEGLLGGVLATGWALLEVPERQPKLDVTGLKKIEGKQLHELRYRPRRGAGDMQVTLYFDPESWRHVRTQYRLVIPARMGATPAESAGQRETVSMVVEEFGDFKEVDGLTLPHSYRLQYTIEGQRSTFLADWKMVVQQLLHNQEIDPKFFTVQ